MMHKVLEIQDTRFAEAVSKGVVLADFWAPWCGPCRMQGPILEEVATAVGDAASIIKVNVDSSPVTSDSLNIRSIPTLILFKDGKPVKQFIGLQRKEALVTAIRQCAATAVQSGE